MTIEAFLTQLEPPHQTLEAAHDLALAGAGVLGALGRQAELEALCDAWHAHGWDGPMLYEGILQLYLFAGFPRAISALGALDASRQRAELPPPADPGPAPVDALAGWRTQGESLCRAIYGRSFDALLDRMRQLSPELASWMIIEGYGKVLSRPALSAPRREAGVIGALTALETGPQLISHLRGALRLGHTPEGLNALLDGLSALLPATSLSLARDALSELAGR